MVSVWQKHQKENYVNWYPLNLWKAINQTDAQKQQIIQSTVKQSLTYRCELSKCCLITKHNPMVTHQGPEGHHLVKCNIWWNVIFVFKPKCLLELTAVQVINQSQGQTPGNQVSRTAQHFWREIGLRYPSGNWVYLLPLVEYVVFLTLILA